MDDTPTPATTQYAVERALLHGALYVEAAGRQREQAQALLAQDPPDFSQAATACHRAHQFTRQAEAVQVLAAELKQ